MAEILHKATDQNLDAENALNIDKEPTENANENIDKPQGSNAAQIKLEDPNLKNPIEKRAPNSGKQNPGRRSREKLTEQGIMDSFNFSGDKPTGKEGENEGEIGKRPPLQEAQAPK